MKVGIIHGNFESLGGSEQVAISLIKCLKKSNHKINLYFINHTKDVIIKEVFREVIQFVNIQKIFQFDIKVFTIYRRLINRILLTRAGDENDVVIETSGVLNPLWKSSKPYIVYCNGFSKEITYKVKVNTKLKKIYLLPYNIIVKNFQKNSNKIHVISNSNYTKKLLNENLGIRSTVIYPPVKLNRFDCKNSKKVSEVVTFGRFSPEKNYELALKLAENLDQKFNFIGSVGDKRYFEKIKSIILKNNISNKVQLIPNCPPDKLNELLCRAKVYLHCRYEEPFGITIIEAISAGCIPIVPDFNAHKETVPFEDLRYKNIEDATKKLKIALEGGYDQLIPKLKTHIKQFDEKTFENKLINYLENL